MQQRTLNQNFRSLLQILIHQYLHLRRFQRRLLPITVLSPWLLRLKRTRYIVMRLRSLHRKRTWFILPRWEAGRWIVRSRRLRTVQNLWHESMACKALSLIQNWLPTSSTQVHVHKSYKISLIAGGAVPSSIHHLPNRHCSHLPVHSSLCRPRSPKSLNLAG